MQYGFSYKCFPYNHNTKVAETFQERQCPPTETLSSQNCVEMLLKRFMISEVGYFHVSETFQKGAFVKLKNCWFTECFQHSNDETVEQEKNNVRNIIENKQLSTKMLVVDNLKRWYCFCRFTKCACFCHTPFIPAVKGVSFVVEKGEIFGLVGSNGAGKTTIFGVLSGALIPSFGTVYMESINILNMFLKYKVSLCS